MSHGFVQLQMFHIYRKKKIKAINKYIQLKNNYLLKFKNTSFPHLSKEAD